MDPSLADARGWTAKFAHDANTVQVAVQSVQGGLKLIQDDPNAGAAEAASLSSLVKQSQDFLNGASLDMVDSLGNPSKTEKTQAWYGADELKDAMGKLRSYIDDQKPSTLSDFQDKYQAGVADWNAGVTAMWGKAGIKPPTV